MSSLKARRRVLWLMREWKSGRRILAGLEENKHSSCELPLGATWQGTVGSLQELRAVSTQQQLEENQILPTTWIKLKEALSPNEKCSPGQTPWFQLSKTLSRESRNAVPKFLTHRLWDKKTYLSHYVSSNFLCSNRKLLQFLLTGF